MEKKQNASKLISSLVALSLATTLGVPSLAIAEEQGATAQPTNAAPASGNEAPTPQEGESAPSEEAVAEIGTYAELANAISSDSGISSIKLTGNITIEATLSIKKDLSIDLGGYTLTGKTDTRRDKYENIAISASAGKVSITNGTINGRVNVYDASDVTIANDVTIKNECLANNGTVYDGYGIVVWGDGQGETAKQPHLAFNGTIDVVNNNVDSEKGIGISTNGLDKSNPTITIGSTAKIESSFTGIYLPAGTLTINGGSITGQSGIETKAGTATISVNGNPTITATGEKSHQASTGSTSTKGYAIAAVENHDYQGAPTITIGSGTFTGGIGLLSDNEVSADKKGNLSISGGTFSDLSALDYTTEDAEIGINLASSATLSSTKFVNAAKVDLNLGEGNTITAENTRAFQVKKGELNITGSGTITSTSTGSLDCSSSVIRVGDNSIAADTKLTIGKDVKVSAPSSYGITAFGAGNESVEINGTVESDAVNSSYDGCAVSTYGTDATPATITVNEGATITAKQSNGIYMPSGNLTVNGGTISGTTGIYVKSGTAAIKGGTIKGTGEKKDYQFYSNGGISTGEALVIDNCGYPNGTPEISVTGGAFESENADAVGSYGKDSNFDEVTGFISGGTFSSDPTDYLAEGYRLVKQADGTYAAQKESSVAPKPKPTTETTTTQNPDGTTTTTVTNKKTGESTSTTEGADGTTIVEKTDASGATTTKITVPEEAAAAGGVVEVPAAIEVASGQEVSISAPAGTVVSIPAGTADAGSVVVVVNADGTETPVPLSLVENGKIIVKLSGDETIKVIDNAKDFVDVPADHWAASDIDFASAREIFKGIDNGNTYEPETALTRNMMMTVLARVDGIDTTGSEPWYASGNQWAVENGVSNGLWGEDTITREQLVTMLFNYANKAGIDTSARADLAAFPDASGVSEWAKDAVSWAVAEGILKGVDNVAIDAQGLATRAQAAAFMARYVHAALL